MNGGFRHRINTRSNNFENYGSISKRGQPQLRKYYPGKRNHSFDQTNSMKSGNYKYKGAHWLTKKGDSRRGSSAKKVGNLPIRLNINKKSISSLNKDNKMKELFVKKRQTGDRFSDKLMNKSKGFSKSYDQNRRQNSSSSKINMNHRRDSSYKSKKYGMRDTSKSKLGYSNKMFPGQKRSKSINNKVFLSHRDYLNSKMAKNNPTASMKMATPGGTFFRKRSEIQRPISKTDSKKISSRNKKALPGLNNFVTQVNANQLAGGPNFKMKPQDNIKTSHQAPNRRKHSAKNKKSSRSIHQIKNKYNQHTTFDDNQNPKFRVTKSGAASPQKRASRDYSKLGDTLLTPQITSGRQIAKLYYLNDLDSYYNLSGKKKGYFTDIYRDHFKHTYVSMQFCKNLKPQRKKAIADRKSHLKRRPEHKNRRTLVLDLDETLIHCNTNSSSKTDISLPVKFPTGEQIAAPINIRPYAREFLKEMSEIYEVIVFTASHSCYANVVIDHLDPKREWVVHRLFRETCIQSDAGVFIKDLRVIDRSLKDMVLVDNASYSFAYQLANGIPIIPFYDSKQDIQLKNLGAYLKELAKQPDFREANKNYFKLHKLVKCTSQSEAFKVITQQITGGCVQLLGQTQQFLKPTVLGTFPQEKIHSKYQPNNAIKNIIE